MKLPQSKYFDFKIGIAGAVVMGSFVFAINYFSTDLLFESLTAALKQAAYTLVLGGFFMKGCEYLAVNVKDYRTAILSAILVPSLVTLCLTYGMHLMKGTPKPLASTIPTLMIIPATAVWAIRKRKTFKKELDFIN